MSGSGNVDTATAQSPFADFVANNGEGINTPASGGNPFFVGTFAPAIGTTATNLLLFNADFRNNTADPGGYSFGGYEQQRRRTTFVNLAITGTSFFAESSGGMGTSIFSPVVGTWYNVQLTWDAGANTYSGTVTPFGGSAIAISSRSFVSSTNPIHAIYTDGGTDGISGVAPDHDIDNFALDVQPAAPPPPVGPPTPVLTVDFNGTSGPELNTTTIGTAVLPAGNGQVYNNIAGQNFSGLPLYDHNGNVDWNRDQCGEQHQQTQFKCGR